MFPLAWFWDIYSPFSLKTSPFACLRVFSRMLGEDYKKQNNPNLMLFKLSHYERRGIVEMRGVFVNHFLLYDERDTILIDTGFFVGLPAIQAALRLIGRDWSDINAILLTHGHLDHALHAAELRHRCDAALICSLLERGRLLAKHPYKGISKVCGALERLGHWGLRYRVATPDRCVEDGEVLDYCGGIRAVSLPGHTGGHTGFWHLPSNILFVGDLINNRRKRHRFPPFFLNSCPWLFPASIAKVRGLHPCGLMSNHGPERSPEEQLRRFHLFAGKYLEKRVAGVG